MVICIVSSGSYEEAGSTPMQIAITDGMLMLMVVFRYLF